MATPSTSTDTVNILLLGETGVGKSTFINSFANYILYGTFEEAAKTKPQTLIPTLIHVYDENVMEDRQIVVGSDKNEKQEIGASATQCVKTYLFPIEGENFVLQLIDTPGLGDSRGIDQDDQNCAGVLAYLAQVDYIHGICLLMKPSNDRNTALFSYCVRRILSQLHKSAGNNIIFLFTNTKGSDYRGGATLPILRQTINQIAAEPPHVKIPIGGENVFCLDNEGFKHLLALDYGVKLDRRTLKSCETSWEISCEEIQRFLHYVKNLDPHNIKTTVSINKTRDLILQMSKPLADICQLLQLKISTLSTRKSELDEKNQTIENLKKNLYKPGVDLEIVNLEKPSTVCTSDSCVEPVKVGNTIKYRYKTRCHDPCLTGYVAYEIIGHWSLATCSEMDWSFCCKHCKCGFKKHMTVFYDTRIVQVQLVEQDVLKNLKNEQEQRAKVAKIVEELEQDQKELNNEMDFVRECAAKFAYFLQVNAITSSYDSFKEYIHLALHRERNLGQQANVDVITHLQDTLAKHEELIKAFKVNKDRFNTTVITEESIQQDFDKLFTLKHSGPKFKAIFDARAQCLQNASKMGFVSVLSKAVPKWFWKSKKNPK